MNGPRALLKGGVARGSYNRRQSCQRASQSLGRAAYTAAAGPATIADAEEGGREREKETGSGKMLKAHALIVCTSVETSTHLTPLYPNSQLVEGQERRHLGPPEMGVGERERN